MSYMCRLGTGEKLPLSCIGTQQDKNEMFFTARNCVDMYVDSSAWWMFYKRNIYCFAFAAQWHQRDRFGILKQILELIDNWLLSGSCKALARPCKIGFPCSGMFHILCAEIWILETTIRSDPGNLFYLFPLYTVCEPSWLQFCLVFPSQKILATYRALKLLMPLN